MSPHTEASPLLSKEVGAPHGSDSHHHAELHHQNSHIKNLGEDVPLYARREYGFQSEKKEEKEAVQREDDDDDDNVLV